MLGHFSCCQRVSESLLHCYHNNRIVFVLRYIWTDSPLSRMVSTVSLEGLCWWTATLTECFLPLLVLAVATELPSPSASLAPHHLLPKDAKYLPDLLWPRSKMQGKEAHKGSGKWEVRASQGCPWRLKSHLSFHTLGTLSMAWDGTGYLREGLGKAEVPLVTTVLGGSTALPSQCSPQMQHSQCRTTSWPRVCLPGLWGKATARAEWAVPWQTIPRDVTGIRARTADTTNLEIPFSRGPCPLFIGCGGGLTSGQIPWWEASDCEHKGLALGQWDHAGGESCCFPWCKEPWLSFSGGCQGTRTHLWCPLGKPHRTQGMSESGRVLWRSLCATTCSGRAS